MNKLSLCVHPQINALNKYWDGKATYPLKQDAKMGNRPLVMKNARLRDINTITSPYSGRDCRYKNESIKSILKQVGSDSQAALIKRAALLMWELGVKRQLCEVENSLWWREGST